MAQISKHIGNANNLGEVFISHELLEPFELIKIGFGLISFAQFAKIITKGFKIKS